MKYWRIALLLCFFFVLGALLAGRLFFVQVIDHKLYQSQLLGQQAGFQEVTGNRGQVFFANSKESHGSVSSGEIKSLAINNEKWLLSAVPAEVTQPAAASAALAKILGLPENVIKEKLSAKDSYVIIQKEVSDGEMQAIKKLALAGLTLENYPVRQYPQQTMASQVIGFVGGDNNGGQYGLEGYYNDVLQGKDGVKESARGLAVIGADSRQQSLDGSDLYLTIDYNIQFQAEQLLQQAKDKLNIDSGQIIVLKPDTGRVLALANYPSFNPNEYGKVRDYAIFQDAAVQQLFEPGSIFKPFTMAMALDSGKVTPATTFNDTGSVSFGKDTVFNFDHKQYGQSDMSKILEKSINTGAVFLEQHIPHQSFIDYLDKYEINSKTGVDLQGEVASRNERLKTGSDFDFATAAFGQGVEMTPMQIARSFCMFANGGKLVKPYVVDKIVHGSDESDTRPDISSPVISQSTANEVTQMLINVVERGFGNIARIPGYYLAGKTGTAQVPYKDKKGYYPDRTIQSFVGYGPAWKPQFLILVKLDDPKVSESALSAAPVFKQLAQYIIDYWQIPPDYQP